MERHYKQDAHNLFDHAGMEDVAAEVRNAHSIQISMSATNDERNSKFENLGDLLERRQHERRRQGPPSHVHWGRGLPKGECRLVNLKKDLEFGCATFLNSSSLVHV